jgi:hypothetical protein
MSKTNDVPICMRDATWDEIRIAIAIVRRINHGSAYGRNPKLCRASSDVLHEMEGKLEEARKRENRSDKTEEACCG